MIENGQLCPVCNKNQMPPWSSKQENARACQNCGAVEERRISNRKEGYYWITNRDGSNLSIGLWKGHNWFLCGFTTAYPDMFEVKGIVGAGGVLGTVTDWIGE